MDARTGQDGTLYQEGRKQTDSWLPDRPAYLRIYLDVPGMHNRQKRNVALGKFADRREARRAADKWIMQNGINDRAKLEVALQPTDITFRSQAAWFPSEIASGRLKSRQKNKRGEKIRTTTLDAYTTAIAYLNEQIGDMPMATFDNAEMKNLIADMESETKKGVPRFSPKTVVNYYHIVAGVFATAKDRKGKQLFPRQWDLNYIGLPAVNKAEQNTPTLEATEIETVLSLAKTLYRVLYILLAGTEMRISEVLGLEIGKHFSRDCSTIDVRRQRAKKGHGVEPYAKTDAGKRDIDVTPVLAALVKDYIGSRKSGFLFETSGGLPMSPRNIARDSLHPILKRMGRASAGFHVFRRFREAILQMSDVRTLLINYWMGHADAEMSTCYGKQLLTNTQWRQVQAARVSLGFTLPQADDGQVGQVLVGAVQQANAA